MPLALTFVEVTEYWTSAKASVQYSVTSTKLQASDKIYCILYYSLGKLQYTGTEHFYMNFTVYCHYNNKKW